MVAVSTAEATVTNWGKELAHAYLREERHRKRRRHRVRPRRGSRSLVLGESGAGLKLEREAECTVVPGMKKPSDRLMRTSDSPRIINRKRS